eukprot:gene17146-17337_t
MRRPGPTFDSGGSCCGSRSCPCRDPWSPVYGAHLYHQPDMTTRDDLRRQMRIVRKGLAGSAAQAARALAGHLAALPVESASGLVVTVYRAAGSEIDPAPLVAALRRRGARIALPVVIARETPLTFRIWTEGETLFPDAAGIPAPPPEAQDGGGYYDRTLRALRHSGPLIAVGLAFAAQEVEEVPMAPRV